MILAYRRPHYLEQVLEAIEKSEVCVDIIRAYVDGPRTKEHEEGVIENLRLLREFGIETVKRPHNMYIDTNMLDGIFQMFKKVDDLIVIEEDVVPLKGFFHWIEWGLENLVKKGKAQSILGYSNPKNRNQPPDGYTLENWFTPWGWATTKRAWYIFYPWIRLMSLYRAKLLSTTTSSFSMIQKEMIKNHPFRKESKHYPFGAGWDHFTNQMYEIHGLLEASPCIPRVKNIGVEGAHQKGDLPQTAEKCITSEEIEIPSNYREIQ